MINLNSSSSRLALGTAQFGLNYGIANYKGQISKSEARRILNLAEVNGVNIIDTAIAYGESEKYLGEVGAEQFKIVTKLPAVPNDCTDIPAWIEKKITGSLSRLGVDAIYGLLLHEPKQLLNSDGKIIYQALQKLQHKKLIQKIGVSIYNPAELDALVRNYRFDLVQAPLNLIDRRLSTSGWLQRLKQNNIEIHTRSVFLQGLLLAPYLEILPKFSPWKRLWKDWQNWLSINSVTAIQACLAYPLSFPEVDYVVVGVDSMQQLQQIFSAKSFDMTHNFPDISCDEENLINPARWSQL